MFINPSPKAVLCGSYHRDFEGLANLFTELETTGCRILAPFSIDFLSTESAVVHTADDQDLTIADMETVHLLAIRNADFIMAHLPEGYAGTSTTFEIGYAAAMGKPVFARHKPVDEMLSARVLVVRSVFEALACLDRLPATSVGRHSERRFMKA